MNQITIPPERERTFGHEFNYAVWTAGTQVTLCNVPWNSDYRDIVRFDSQTDLDSYLMNQPVPTIDIKGVTYAKPGTPVLIDVPFNKAYEYNYLRVHNPAQPISGDKSRSFYYFITDVQYAAPNTTRLMVQLDVWQTFGYNAKFGNCYIERGHIGIANEMNFNNHGRDYLTIPEGLDVGNEYRIVDQWRQQVATARGAENAGVYSVLVMSTVDLTQDPGTVDKPKLNSAKGSRMSNLPNGADIYLFENASAFRSFMSAFSDKPWMTQGIISITAIPSSSRYLLGTEQPVNIDGINILKIRAGSMYNKEVKLKTNWRQALESKLPARYRHLKKFFTSPYMVLEMTSYTGTPLVIKPEAWNDNDATVVEVPHFAPPGARLMFYPFRYNADGVAAVSDQFGTQNDGGEFLDFATGILNFPTFSLVNNGYMSYLASNQNSIAFQHQSADWSQNRAIAGANLAYGQAGANMATSQTQMQLGVNAAQQSTNLANQTAGFRTVQGMANGVISGAAAGVPGIAAGAVGMANQVAGLAIDTNQNNQSMGIATNLARQQNAAGVANMGYMRDSNLDYAEYAAQGDYQNAVAGINARVQDAKMIQPTTAGQLGGDAFNLAAYKWGYDVKVKLLQSGAMANIGEYWLRYGYAVNRFGTVPDDFQVMSKASYWKLKETYISAAGMPESFKQALRGIFEKGVTVWHDPKEVGLIDWADNKPLSGVTL